jgi:lyso-ornithine lipid O-acyltransferase
LQKQLRKLKQPLRFLGIFGVIAIFFLLTSIVWLVTRDRWKRVHRWTIILHYSAWWACWCLAVRVKAIGHEAVPKDEGVLFVGNHLSYIDVIVISSQVSTCFVTSVEIKETPFLGQVCQMAGCLFVERRTRSQLTKEIGELGEGLERGLSVTVFPEATSTNGESVLRFRRPLFLAAVQAKKPVVPICVNYRVLADKKLDITNRDQIFWYGDMPFASHLWELCGLDNIEVDLNFLKVIRLGEKQEAADLAEEAHAAVTACFLPVKPLTTS